MTYSAEEANGIVIVHLAGSIRAGDNALLENFMHGIDLSACRGVVLDLKGLEHLNSRAIGTIMALWKRAAAEAKRVVLTRPQPLVARLLGSVGLYNLLPAYPDVESACASFEE